MYVLDLPPLFLEKIQTILLDFFWDGHHWLRQRILYLLIVEEGQGLIDLLSRITTFLLQALEQLDGSIPWRQLTFTFL